MVYNAIMANGKSPKYYVDKYCDKLEKEIEQRRLEERERLRREEERAKAQKDSSQDEDVRREDYGKILTHEDLVNLEFRMFPRDVNMRGGYGIGLIRLRESCLRDVMSAQPTDSQGKVRPLTAREHLLAGIIDYERKKDSGGRKRTDYERLMLFQRGSFTSTGMIYLYERNAPLVWHPRLARVIRKAKIQQICPYLINLNLENEKQYVKVDYNNVNAPEVDLTRVKWNEKLSKSEVLEHEGWINLAGDDEEGRRILSNYVDIVFSNLLERQRESKAMRFYKKEGVTASQVIAPWIYSMDEKNYTPQYNKLNYYAAFLEVSHVA